MIKTSKNIESLGDKNIKIFLDEKSSGLSSLNRGLKFWTFSLRGNCTPNQKLACFVLYFKMINTFLKIICVSYSKLVKELKSEIEICSGPAVFKLWIKIVNEIFFDQ